ncbi:MAG: hypothetical protein WCF61_03210 [Terriglobales bacterium]
MPPAAWIVGVNSLHWALCVLGFGGLSFLSGQLLGELVNIHRVLMRLSGKFVRGQVISFTVRDSGRSVSVGGKVVHFRESIVRALWHVVLLRRLVDGCAHCSIQFYPTY